MVSMLSVANDKYASSAISSFDVHRRTNGAYFKVFQKRLSVAIPSRALCQNSREIQACLTSEEWLGDFYEVTRSIASAIIDIL
jgi:hypothetical protein